MSGGLPVSPRRKLRLMAETYLVTQLKRGRVADLEAVALKTTVLSPPPHRVVWKRAEFLGRK